MSLTNDDLKNIKTLMEVTISEKLDEACENRLATKEDISHLPKKDEFYAEMSEIRTDLATIHDELAILNHRTSNHEDRLVVVEKKLKAKPSFV